MTAMAHFSPGARQPQPLPATRPAARRALRSALLAVAIMHLGFPAHATSGGGQSAPAVTNAAPARRLLRREVVRTVRQHLRTLERCLRLARQEDYLTAHDGPLVMALTVNPGGGVSTAEVQAPQGLLLSEYGGCIEAAAGRWRFPAFAPATGPTELRVPVALRAKDSLPIAASVGKIGPDGRPMDAHPGTTLGSSLGDWESAGANSAAGAGTGSSVSGCGRSHAEIMTQIATRQAKLQSCIEAEVSRHPDLALPDHLPVELVVKNGGALRDIRVNHRHYRGGPLAKCVAKSLASQMPKRPGTDCPAIFKLDLRDFERQRRARLLRPVPAPAAKRAKQVQRAKRVVKQAKKRRNDRATGRGHGRGAAGPKRRPGGRPAQK